MAKVTYNAIRMKHAEAHHVRETKVVMCGKNDKALRYEPLNLPLGHWRVAAWLEGAFKSGSESVGEKNA